jgi:hypothetical protein
VTAALLDHLKQHMPFLLLPIFFAFCHVFLKVELGPLHSTQKRQEIQLDKQVCQKTRAVIAFHFNYLPVRSHQNKGTIKPTQKKSKKRCSHVVHIRKWVPAVT